MPSKLLRFQNLNPDTFRDDMSEFAFKMAAQVEVDWAFFRTAFEEGKFNF